MIVLLLPVSLIFPFALIIVGLIAWSINDDLRRPIRQAASQGQNASKEIQGDWLSVYCELCESPAEVAFLKAMVKAFDLEPQDGFLQSPKLKLQLQVSSSRYRYDFVANGRQIIEIDGAAYHSTAQQMERDRIRDQRSIAGGYRVLRIPAMVVFNHPEEAIARLKAVLEETPTFMEPQEPGIGEVVRIAAQSLRTASRDALIRVKVFNAMANLKNAINAERDQLQTLIKLAETQLELDQTPGRRQLSEKVAKAYLDEDRISQSASRLEDYAWADIPGPDPVEDKEVLQKIEREFKRITGERSAWIEELGRRCAESADFSEHLGRKLYQANYPSKDALKIVSSAHYSMKT